MASVSGGEHRRRYLRLFQAYECLQEVPHQELAAVRHGLSHAPGALSRPSTVRTLVQLFGSTSIDTESAAHLRVLYRQFVRLAVEVDALMRQRIVGSLKDLRVLPGPAPI